jgi:hypothetical protein
MKFVIFALIIALVQGLAATGILALLNAIVVAFNPAFILPFSIWWGMVFSIPGLAISAFIAKSW